jgi:hypothetical protein
MDSYDYVSSDNIGRRVEVTDHVFQQSQRTVYGDGSSSTSTGVFHW